MSPDVKEALSSFLETGYASLGPIVNTDPCKALLRQIRSGSELSRALFQDNKDFCATPIDGETVNPRTGRNILEHLDTSFVEQNLVLDQVIAEILGPGYETLTKKVVAAIPSEWIPRWVKREIMHLLVPNLGSFVKPEYRNITYFHGIAYHQDLIDYPERFSDFITLYVYLDDVGAMDSPLSVFPNSHCFGATTFPHDLVCQDGKRAKKWRYSDGCGNQTDLQQEVLVGKCGSVYLWHSCCLHGTQPSELRRSKMANRISLRYIIAKKDGGAQSLIDNLNEQIRGPLALRKKREEVAGTASSRPQ